MPQQTDSATPTRLKSVDKSLSGEKIRVAGRLLSYEPTTGLVLLLDQNKIILVDVSLCIDPWSSTWIRERLAIIMVIGHIEVTTEALPIPALPRQASTLSVVPNIVLRALLVTPTADLDLQLWNDGIEEGQTGQKDSS